MEDDATAQAVEKTNFWAEVDRSGKPSRSFVNAKCGLSALGLTFCFDTFRRQKQVWGVSAGRFAGELTDDGLTHLRSLFVDRLGLDPGKEHLADAVNALCLEFHTDALWERISATPWDGTARLEGWLTRYAGAADTDLTRSIGMLLPVAMVRRLLQPGVKLDTVVVLEGAQGAGKSSLLRVLAGGAENFTDAPLLTRDARGVAEVVRGKWVVEISELAGLRKAAAEEVKAIISRQDDRARPAYGRHVESLPRQCVFVGTTNAEEYLLDETGNRRFAPVRVGNVRLAEFEADWAQIMAEAIFWEPFYGPLILPPRVWASAHAATEEKRIVDPWVDTLASILSAPVKPGQGATEWETLPDGKRRVTTDAVHRLLGIPAKECNAFSARRIKSAMRALGWEHGRYRPCSGGTKLRGFIENEVATNPGPVDD